MRLAPAEQIRHVRATKLEESRTSRVKNSKRNLIPLLLALSLASNFCGTRPDTLILEKITDQLENPLFLASLAGDPRLFIVEQPGRIRIVKNGKLLPKPFLDISPKVRFRAECGLLGLAFHPDYHTNGYFFINYIDKKGNTRVERYRVSQNQDIADPKSVDRILWVKQPFRNHNGGTLLFGPDGMLYIGMGDGGGSGDRHDNSQNLRNVLGDILRIDIDHEFPYAIPPDNPYSGHETIKQEIWSSGLRNPWRFAFDEDENLLYIADVGDIGKEEINIVPAKKPGLNFGWNILEGTDCYLEKNCNKEGFTPPVLEYTHKEGCSIIGGVVYRGKIRAIRGHYFYGDYCLGWIRSFKYKNGTISDQTEWKSDAVGNILSFSEDAEGELYVLYEEGRVFKIVGVGK